MQHQTVSRGITRSIISGLAAASLVAGAAFGSFASAQERVRWQVPLPFPSGLTGLTTPAQYLADSLKEVSGGKITLRTYEPGELIPPFEILDAVSKGRYPAGYTWVGYDQGTIPALPLYSGAPFNMEPPAYIAWHYFGDGEKLLREIYKPRNVHPLLCGIIGPEAAGWFAKQVNSLDDIKGMRIRFAGIGGKVLERLGASVTLIPGGEIFQALERGNIDATEFSQPAIDRVLGLDKIVKNYIMPGWHQTFTTTHLLVNLDTWNKLDKTTQASIDMGCRAATLTGFAESEWAQPIALREYRESGVKAQVLPEPLLRELYKVSMEVMNDMAKEDEMFARVHKSQREFMEQHYEWHSKGYLPRDFHPYD